MIPVCAYSNLLIPKLFVLEYVAVTLKWDMKEIQSNNQGKCSGLEQRRMLYRILWCRT